MAVVLQGLITAMYPRFLNMCPQMCPRNSWFAVHFGARLRTSQSHFP
jgi:hypothetical protein